MFIIDESVYETTYGTCMESLRQLAQDCCLSSRRRNLALGGCPRIEAVTRESGFESIFSIK